MQLDFKKCILFFIILKGKKKRMFLTITNVIYFFLLIRNADLIMAYVIESEKNEMKLVFDFHTKNNNF